MSDTEIVRAWKDRRYRQRLSEGQRQRLPSDPAGAVQLPDERIQGVAGGTDDFTVYPCTNDPMCTATCTMGCTME